MSNEYREFSSYRALDRTAMFMGIPLLAAVGLLTLGVFFMFVGMFFFDIAGFLFSFLVVPIAFLLRTISENDDKALHIMLLEFKYMAKRISYGKQQLIVFEPDSYYRYQAINEQQFINYDKNS